MSAKVISFINLKGGVAKTTTTVCLAQVLSGLSNKKVLVIDLDPQTNATTMLIGENKWLSLNQEGYTLATLFKDAIYNGNNFNIQKCLQKSVGSVGQVRSVDLLPSSLNLLGLQDMLITMLSGRFGTRRPVDILCIGIGNILDEYDYVLIDCPPNLGFISLNGLRISDGYIIPTIPDILSTYGIPQIVTWVYRFSKEIKKNIVPIGIVATKVRAQAPIHVRKMKEIRDRAGHRFGNSELPYPMVFKSYFLESAKIAEAAEFQEYNTLRQKWGDGNQFKLLEEFMEEFLKATEGK